MKIPRTLRREHERWQEKWNPGPRPELTCKRYILRWQVPCAVVLSILFIPAILIYTLNLGYNDAMRLCLRSLFLLPIAWVGFWLIRFSRYRAYGFWFVGVYGCFYTLVNFALLFRQKINIVGNAYTKGKADSGGGFINFGIFIFFLLFWFCADLLEERSLWQQMDDWSAENIRRKYWK